MSNDWEFFPCTIEDHRASIFVDIGISDTISQAPGNLVILELAYKTPAENGLPTGAEFDAVSQLEDRISAHAEANADWYVGRSTYNGCRNFYLYTTQSRQSWRAFASLLKKESGYLIKAIYQEDPDHEAYTEELYPSDEDWRVIKDLRVIEVLADNGDDGSIPRQIMHWAYFADQSSGRLFASWAVEEGFTEPEGLSHPTDKGEYCVCLVHHGRATIGDLSPYTLALLQGAVEYHGRYDGWETKCCTSGDGPELPA